MVTCPNYDAALAAFKKYKVKHTEKPNNQITVERRGVVVDFWPGTGTWFARTGGKSKGLSNLLTFLFKPESFRFEQAGSDSKVQKMANAKAMLTERAVPYQLMSPYQLRIDFNGGFVDFWPTSEKWSVNGAKAKKGVAEFLQYLERKSVR